MRTRIFPLHVITVVSLWPWKKNLCSSSFTHILRLQVLHWRSVFGEQVWITKSSQAISPTMKLFILSFLVLTSLCFVIGDEDEIKPNFDDLNANDGQMVEDTPDDYVEDEEDNVSYIKFICLNWIRAEFIVNWRFVINIVLKNSHFNAREFIMTNCYPNKSCEIETNLNTHRINCNIHLSNNRSSDVDNLNSQNCFQKCLSLELKSDT